MKVVNLADKFQLFDEHWSPKIVAELNGHELKLAKLKGDFVWHKHEEEDEMFFVVKGRLRIELRDQSLEISENEFVVIPKGVEHLPVAEEEVWVLLFEPSTTRNTGDVEHALSKNSKEYL